ARRLRSGCFRRGRSAFLVVFVDWRDCRCRPSLAVARSLLGRSGLAVLGGRRLLRCRRNWRPPSDEFWASALLGLLPALGPSLVGFLFLFFDSLRLILFQPSLVEFRCLVGCLWRRRREFLLWRRLGVSIAGCFGIWPRRPRRRIRLRLWPCCGRGWGPARRRFRRLILDRIFLAWARCDRGGCARRFLLFRRHRRGLRRLHIRPSRWRRRFQVRAVKFSAARRCRSWFGMELAAGCGFRGELVFLGAWALAGFSPRCEKR